MLSDEEKQAMESLIEIREFANLSNYKDTKISQLNAIDIVLNLIEKQTKEIEEMKKQLDLDNECEIALNSKVMDLEEEIEELKNKNKKLQDKASDLIKELIFENQELTSALLDSTPNDKIKAKIEPVLKQLERKMEEEYNKYGNSREYQDVVDAYNFLQSLLEKE